MIQTQCNVAQTKCNSLHCLLGCICNATPHCIAFITLVLRDKRGNERMPEWPTLANGSSTTRECGENCNSFFSRFSPFFFIFIFPLSFDLPNCWSSTARECWRLQLVCQFFSPPNCDVLGTDISFYNTIVMMSWWRRGRSDPDWLMGTVPQENNTKTGEKSSQRWTWWGRRDGYFFFLFFAKPTKCGKKHKFRFLDSVAPLHNVLFVQ